MSNLIRYRCKNPNCECDYYRGGPNDRECPLCKKNNTEIVEYGVGE